MSKIYLLIITGLLIILEIEIKAQPLPSEAFSNISIRFNFISNHSTDGLNNYWNGDKGIEGLVQTPFYLGDMQAGLRYIPYVEKVPFYHNFSSYFFFLGWGKELNLPMNLSIYAGLKFGAYGMSIHDDSLTEEQRYENELAVGLSSYLALRVFDNFKLILGADYTKVYIYKKIELYLISAGLAYSFKTPGWLKEILY